MMIMLLLAAVLCAAGVACLFWILQASDKATAEKLRASMTEAADVLAR